MPICVGKLFLILLLYNGKIVLSSKFIVLIVISYRIQGKDSYTMLDILMNLQKSAPVKFELVAVNMDQKQPGFPEHVLPNYLDSLGIEYYIVNKDTYSIVKEKIPEGKTTCGLCSRLRRGTLYGFAEDIGANKIALGHHKDDIVQTLFLNMFYGSRMAAMPPKLLSDDKRNVIIRPLAYCREADIEQFSAYKEFPIIPCNLCGSQENLQRQNIRQMLLSWEKQDGSRIEKIFSAMQNIAPSQMADPNLFNFADLTLDRSEPRAEYPFDAQQTIDAGGVSLSPTGVQTQLPAGIETIKVTQL
ncbi:tRNA 2-thiocytidine(32) synthetase TtcA [Spongiibacter sp. KMU-158]|uniref:tRNA-cytidine(32) 2-sulfurtransferase n=1 Tax=Spongiibacter pelagi TaxID=2760804 RepID=A0A927C3X2_9GAMM|nr:tRNA 2-thiocytidine(32) synthetase TtcA [Spongiibacter pelagi]